jgi:hypothetical protein
VNCDDNELTTERSSTNKICDAAKKTKEEEGVDSEEKVAEEVPIPTFGEAIAMRLSESRYAHSNLMMQAWLDWIK